jgi:hypothetical protein
MECLNDCEQTLNALERDASAEPIEARVAGFRLTVRPTVFHPRYFLTSEFFANFLGMQSNDAP